MCFFDRWCFGSTRLCLTALCMYWGSPGSRFFLWQLQLKAGAILFRAGVILIHLLSMWRHEVPGRLGTWKDWSACRGTLLASQEARKGVFTQSSKEADYVGLNFWVAFSWSKSKFGWEKMRFWLKTFPGPAGWYKLISRVSALVMKPDKPPVLLPHHMVWTRVLKMDTMIGFYRQGA